MQLLPTSPTYLLPFLPPTHLPPSCIFLRHSLLFHSPPSPVLEKQGQLERLGLGFTCDLALKFSFEGFEFPHLQEPEEGRTFRSVERGGVSQELAECVEVRTLKVSFLSLSIVVF